MEQLVISETENGSCIELKVKHHLLIRLEENPTTAYRWEAPENTNTGVFVSSVFKQFPDVKTGGGGTREFLFEALTPGTEKLEFKLRRKWDQTDSFAKQFEILIVVV